MSIILDIKYRLFYTDCTNRRRICLDCGVDTLCPLIGTVLPGWRRCLRRPEAYAGLCCWLYVAAVNPANLPNSLYRGSASAVPVQAGLRSQSRVGACRRSVRWSTATGPAMALKRCATPW